MFCIHRGGMYGSEGSLPKMEPSVMAGQTRLIVRVDVFEINNGQSVDYFHTAVDQPFM